MGVPLSAYAAQKPIIVWPDNKNAVKVFRRMIRRWHTGMGGPSHMDLSRFDDFCELAGVTEHADRLQVLDSITEVMEPAALRAMHTKD